jgi:hypothetical protein
MQMYSRFFEDPVSPYGDCCHCDKYQGIFNMQKSHCSESQLLRLTTFKHLCTSISSAMNQTY